MNTWHNGKNLGQAPLKILVVFVSEEGKKNFIRAEGQPKPWLWRDEPGFS